MKENTLRLPLFFRKDILDFGVEELLDRLKSGQLHPVAVLEAYQAKALTVNKEINAVCDFILEATEQAEALAQLPPDTLSIFSHNKWMVRRMAPVSEQFLWSKQSSIENAHRAPSPQKQSSPSADF